MLLGDSYTVVGIAPPSFRGLNHITSNDVWVPASTMAAMPRGYRQEFENRGARPFKLLGRLRPGVGMEQVQAQLSTITANLARTYPASNAGRRVQVAAMARDSLKDYVAVGLIMSIPGLVLLIACVNVATLLLARMQVRAREIGVRLALGAGRARLTRQVLTESLLLSVAGSAVGWLLAWWFVASIPAFLPAGPIRFDIGVHLDGRVLGLTLALSAITALLFGSAPAWQASRADLLPVLKGGEPAPAGRAAAVQHSQRPGLRPDRARADPGLPWPACCCAACNTARTTPPVSTPAARCSP